MAFKTLEGIGSESLYVINNVYKYFLSVKKIKNRAGYGVYENRIELIQ